MRADPDGYTIVMGQMGTHAAAVALYPNLAYRARCRFRTDRHGHRVSVDHRGKEGFSAEGPQGIRHLCEGEHTKLNVAHAGVGSIFFTTCLLLNSILDAKPTLVPFNGGAPAMNALVAGQVDYMCADIVTGGPQLEAGKIKVYAIASAARNPAMPNVPTTAEAGLPEFQASAWNGLFAPKGDAKANPRPARRRARQGARRRGHAQAPRCSRRRYSRKAKSRPAAVSRAGQERDRALVADHQGGKR